MKVLCIGHASYDFVMYTDDFPSEGSKNQIKENISCPGGSALIFSLLLGKWGIDVSYMGFLGCDKHGKKIAETLKNNNVNIEYTMLNEKTETDLVLVNKQNTSKTILSIENNNNLECKKELEKDFDLILMDSNYVILSDYIIEKSPNAIKIISVNMFTEEVINVCKKCDYVICNIEDAVILSNIFLDYKDIDSIRNILISLEQKLKTNVIILCNQDGCIYRLNDKIKIMSSLKVKVKDTTGAKEIFTSAFSYGKALKLPLEKCLKIANITSSLSKEKLGSSLSIPEVEEVYKIYEKR